MKNYSLSFVFLLFFSITLRSYADIPNELTPIISRLPRCENNKVRHQCVDTIMNEKILYIGEFHNGKMEGYGNIYQQSVLRFAGEFKDGKKNGFGRSLRENGEYSEGTYKNNKLNGFGTTLYRDGTRYVGEYKDGKFDGYGTMLMRDGSKFTGISRGGEPNGEGVIEHFSGAKLIGNFRGSTLDGPGTIIQPDGVRVDAIFKNGEIAKITARSDVVGDGSPDDQFCKSQGINPGTADYDGCRINVAVNRQIANDRKAQNELQQRFYEEQMELIRQNRRDQQSIAIFGLLGNLLSSPKQRHDFMPFVQPTPVYDQFTIFRSDRSSISCVSQSNVIDCR
jgi:hypothetical protein